MRSRRVETLEVRIPKAQVFRLLGMHRKKRDPRPSVIRAYEEEVAIAAHLVAAKAVTTSFRTGLPGSRNGDPDIPVAAGVCTIGPRLEERVTDLSSSGQTARAMILDAIGSAAVEDVVDRVNGEICDRALTCGGRPGPRRSPGYGGWDLSEQTLLFDALDPAEIGVELAESFMMIPRKSVSFVVPLEGGVAGLRGVGRCARCGLLECAFRGAKARRNK
jgi:cobalamin-dependent methionine synthase-like protein